MKFDDFTKFAEPGKIVPVFRRRNADFITPVMAYLKLKDGRRPSFLLESVLKGEQLGRYSFIGINPFQNLTFRESNATVSGTNGRFRTNKRFFEVLKTELTKYRRVEIAALPCFTGGAVGFIGYDMVREIEKLTSPPPDSVGIDDAVLGFYDDLVAFDHLRNEVILIANIRIDPTTDLQAAFNAAEMRLNEMEERLNRPMPSPATFRCESDAFRSNFSEAAFGKAVCRAKDHIFAGDIFQAVISQRFRVPFAGEVFQVYRSLRNINPSPYLFFLDFIDYQLIGSSPEPLIRAEEGRMEIVPIAGTRPRGSSKEEDQANAESLLNDPKELAEHVMLVDLARNDIGKFSRHGSVRVTDFQTIERYSHVMHIISRVHGELAPGHTPVDAFQAAFPAGTVSGAPKIRAMEIIDELEPEKRGFYAGAVGYFDYGGNMDVCIAIRTLLAHKNTLYFQAGAGIVADSIPENEYVETLNKGMALKKAVEQAAEGVYDFVH